MDIQNSIIIPSYNEGAWLEYTLARLEPTLDESTEIIVVDDGSTDGSLSRVEKMDWPGKLHLPILERNKKRLGAAAARNIGASMAHGDYLIFLDAHVAPISQDWIDLLVAPLNEIDGAAITCGAQVGLRPLQWADYAAGQLPMPPREKDVVKYIEEGASYATGCRLELENGLLAGKWIEPKASMDPYRIQIGKAGCMAVDRRKLRTGQLFDQGLAYPIGFEDDELSLRAWRLGYKVLAVPDAFMGIHYRQSVPYRGMSYVGQMHNILRTAVRLFSWDRVEYLVSLLAANERQAEVVVRVMRSSALQERAVIEHESPLEDMDFVWDEFGEWMP